MKVNSRQKGKRGEREAVLLLRSIGFTEARRTQQYCGNAGASDVVLSPSSTVHVEVKFGYPISKMDLGLSTFDAAVRKCQEDCGGQPWIILWKPKGHRQWRASVEEQGGTIVTRHGKRGVERALNALGVSADA